MTTREHSISRAQYEQARALLNRFYGLADKEVVNYIRARAKPPAIIWYDLRTEVAHAQALQAFLEPLRESGEYVGGAQILLDFLLDGRPVTAAFQEAELEIIDVYRKNADFAHWLDSGLALFRRGLRDADGAKGGAA